MDHDNSLKPERSATEKICPVEKIENLRKKIQYESKMKEGVDAIIPLLSTKDELSKALKSREESINRINYLQQELERLVVENGENVEEGEKPEELSTPEKDPEITFYQIPVKLSHDRILAKLCVYQTNLSTEEKLLEGARRMISAYASDPSKKSVSSAVSKTKGYLQKSETRIRFLKKIIKKYMDILNDIEGKISSNFTGFMVTGAISNASYEMHIIGGEFYDADGNIYNKPISFSFSIDSKEVFRSKPKNNVNLKEFVTIQNKGTWGEFIFWNRKDEPISLLTIYIPHLFSSNLSASDDAVILELEPRGHIYVVFNHPKTQEEIKEITKADLKRNIEIIKKIVSVRGHDFCSFPHFKILKCGVCSDFIIRNTSARCEHCHFVCHTKCCDKVAFICLMDKKLQREYLQRRKFTYSISHLFEEASLALPAWCGHCGIFLPLLSHKVLKCGECSIAIHSECRYFLPNYCGATDVIISHITKEISEMEKEIMNEVIYKNCTQRFRNSVCESKGSDTGLSTIKISKSTKTNLRRDNPNFSRDYEILKVLGRGNFGKVMLVREKDTGKLFAAKALDLQYVIERGEYESVFSEKSVFMLAHYTNNPFLLSLHACFVDGSYIFFIMEYASGGDLMWHIQNREIPYNEVQQICAEIVLSIECFHNNNIAYRDLKLDNVLLGPDGHIKMADYGLCKLKLGPRTTTTTFCGTPEFIAPEIILERPYTRAVDWWTLGVFIYQMLQGTSPFRGNTEAEIFSSILVQELRFVRPITQAGADIIIAFLNRNPEKRLGASNLGASEVKAHPFFNNVNFDDLLNGRTPGKYAPSLEDATDTKFFDESFTNEAPCLSYKQMKINFQPSDFEGFSFMMKDDA